MVTTKSVWHDGQVLRETPVRRPRGHTRPPQLVHYGSIAGRMRERVSRSPKQPDEVKRTHVRRTVLSSR
jgi:hypothetical protein